MKGAIIFLFAVAGCFADPVPATPAPQIDCKSPPNILPCIGSPQLMKMEFLESCRNCSEECEATKCFFTNAGFLADNKINKTKVAEYYDEYASKNKDWTTAVTNLKTDCLGEQDLPQQGVIANCPAYDIFNCVHVNFIKHALPSQWKDTPECKQAHTFLANCPFCPDDMCQIDSIAPGTCNGCKVLLKSP